MGACNISIDSIIAYVKHSLNVHGLCVPQILLIQQSNGTTSVASMQLGTVSTRHYTSKAARA